MGQAVDPSSWSDPARSRRRVQSWLFLVVFVVLAAATTGGFLEARDRARETTERRAERAAALAADAIETEFGELAAGLAGSAAVVRADGTLDVDVFDAFARDLVVTGEVPGVVLVGAPESGQAIEHPVLAMTPEPQRGSLVGSDFGASPMRRATLNAAATRGRVVVSGVAPLVATGEPGIEVIRPLFHDVEGPSTVRGFVATGVPLARLGEIAQAAAGTREQVVVVNGASVLVGTPFDRRLATTSARASVPGQVWTVVVGPPDAPDLTTAWLVLAGGAVAVAVLAALVVATERNQRRLQRANVALAVSEERTRALQEVAGRLARALTGGEVAVALIEHLPAAVGARSVVLAVRNDAGELELLRPETADAERRPVLTADIAGSIVDATLRTGRPSWLSSPLEWRDDPATAALAGDASALAVLPLSADDVVGVLAVSYPRVRIFGDDEQALLQTVGILSARALSRGRQYDAEHRAALAFQRAALPTDLPSVDGLAIAARYRPATRHATVGGDWYDALLVDDDRIVFVVGDVVGHGIVAAAAMGRLRTAFQAVAPLRSDPGAMLQVMNHQVASIPDAFCTTVVCAVVDLRSRTMTWCRAGHPPPLLLRRGRTQLLDERCLPPLGVAPDAPAHVHTRSLEPGDVLVLYTDGLIERRGESIDKGFRRLGIVADSLADLDPEEFGEALVEALVPVDEQADDLAVLVVRVDGVPADADAAAGHGIDVDARGVPVPSVQ